MAGRPDDFADRYAQLGESELNTIAGDYDSLTETAQGALRAEFARRKLMPPLVEEDVLESRKLVTLRRYRDITEAMVARSLLESAGIVVYLRDENMIRLDWQLSNFIGGLRLQVDESDAETALELLNQPIPESIRFNALEEFAQPLCPVCGSLDIVSQAEHLGAAMVSTVGIGVPLPVGRKVWICRVCDARWDDVPE